MAPQTALGRRFQPLLQEVVKEALQAGAHPEPLLSVAGLQRLLYAYGDDSQIAYVSPLYRYAVEHFDALLNIRSPFNVRELETVEAEKKKLALSAQGEVKSIFSRRAAEGRLKWTLCEFPTESQAQESGLSRREYEEHVFASCLLYDEDPSARWREVHDQQQAIVDRLRGKKQIRIVAPDSDLSFSVEDRVWINSDGRRNMPSGEIFTSPVEESVQGRIRFSYPGIFMGQEIEDIVLEVSDGTVVGWDARKGRDLLSQVLSLPGANRLGEAAIGTNRGITRFTRNMLFDEKMGGTIHCALGSSYHETGGRNESAVHWDLLADMKEGGEIYADGELIYRNGEFVGKP